MKATDRNSMILASIFGPDALKQGMGGSDDSLIILIFLQLFYGIKFIFVEQYFIWKTRLSSLRYLKIIL